MAQDAWVWKWRESKIVWCWEEWDFDGRIFFSDPDSFSAVQTSTPAMGFVKKKKRREWKQSKGKMSVCSAERRMEIAKNPSFEWTERGMCLRKKRHLFYQSTRDRKLTAERNKTYTDRVLLSLSHPWHQFVCENILCQCACFIKRDWCCLCGQRRLVLEILFCVSKYYKKHMWQAHVICLYFL